MGAEPFAIAAVGASAAEAFNAAVQRAQYDNGHSGYTGTIAEKGSYVMVVESAMAPKDAVALANEMLDNEDPRIFDKFGPAGCIAVTNGKFLFFGWASS